MVFAPYEVFSYYGDSMEYFHLTGQHPFYNSVHLDIKTICQYTYTLEYMFICLSMSAQKTTPLDEQTAAHVADLFRAFSDVSRVRILSVLTAQEMNVGDLAEVIGISVSAVSHQMRGLPQMGLAAARRNGREVFYRIEDEHIIVLFQQGVRHIQDE
jgi:DNA-binding transcriptional ArsR family regulator